MTKWSSPQGAELTEFGIRYSVWAPERDQVSVEVYTGTGNALARTVTLLRENDGYFRGTDRLGVAGDRYKIRPGSSGETFPAPGSQWQPAGVHGPSQVIEHGAYSWHDAQWNRPSFRDLVIYELHIGTFTVEGTFRAAIEKLPHLAELGINAIEIMPFADFPGDRNWGYDGVQLYAPARCYGHPDDLRAFVDAAHRAGIAVILDVVYNHFGPDGNYLAQFSPYYVESVDKTPWGNAINFGRENSEPVRDFFTANIVYWMDLFHIDGFRLDATHAIHDCSETHILAEIAGIVTELGGYVIAEDERNLAQLITPHAEGGFGFTAMWADDFHHTIEVAAIDASVYRADFKGDLRELADALAHGCVYRGQITKTRGEPRGTPCNHLPPERFIFCISNHDQVGNRAFGERLNQLVSPETYRAVSALLLLSPYTPLLFMGQEWACSTPFQYFTDHNEELGRLVEKGRREEFREAFAHSGEFGSVPSPQAEETFLRSKLKWDETHTGLHANVLRLYQQLLQLRRGSAAFRPSGRESWRVFMVKNAVLAMRLSDANTDWLILCDLRGGSSCAVEGEEICDPPHGFTWECVLATDQSEFGGNRSSVPGWEPSITFTEPELLLFRAKPARSTE